MKKCECPECDIEMVARKVPYYYQGKKIGIYDAITCPKCKVIYYTEKSLIEIEKECKRLGIWGKKAFC